MPSSAIKALFNQGLIWHAQSSEARKDNYTEFLQKDEKNFSGPLSAPFGIEEIDRSLSSKGLEYGNTHEFFYPLIKIGNFSPAPLFLLTTLLRNAFLSQKEPRFVFWIGKESWPSSSIVQHLFKEFIDLIFFIDPPDSKAAFWATELTLSSPATLATVACCNTPLTLSQTKKLSLAARKGGSLGFIIRNPEHINQSSSATSRWLIEPSLAPEALSPLWSLKLLKIKGARSLETKWIIKLSNSFDEDSQEKISLHLFSDMVDGYSSAKDRKKRA